jgi:hypothetical protein
MKKCLYFLKILKDSGNSFITGKVLLQIYITENCFQKHFRLTKVLYNLLFIYKSQTRTSPMYIFLPSLYVNLGENFPDKRSGAFCGNSTNLLF